MMSRHQITGALEASGAIAIVRTQEADQVRHVVEALAKGGVTALEITMTVPRAVELIAAVAAEAREDFLLGAGTVLDPETARAVILAGARFVVAPSLNLDVIRMCQRYGVAVLPGCFSPTEILTAWEAGADLVKVFPAGVLGPGFIRDVRAPLPHVRLVPTGGVTIENAGEWIRAGAAAVGIGSALVDGRLVASRRFDEIEDRARRLVEAIGAAR